MKTYAVITLFLAILLSNITLTAQEDDIPFPPDPADIFAEGVEVEIFEPIPSIPLPEVDNDARVVRVYDSTAESWRDIPYPEGIPEGVEAYRMWRSDDSNVLYVRDVGVWLIDELNFELVELGFICDTEIPELLGGGAWVYVTNPETEQVHLCFTETGELSIPLPEVYNWVIGANGDRISVPQLSPSGEWVVLIGAETTRMIVDGVDIDYEYDMAYHVYSYNISDDSLNYLGAIWSSHPNNYPPSLWGEWVSDVSATIMYGYPQESSGKSFYGFDVTQPDSVTLILQGWLYDFNPESQRYEYMVTETWLRWKSGGYDPNAPLAPCTLTTYDYRGTLRFEIGYDCIGAWFVSRGDDYYIVRVDDNPAITSTLIRFNIGTGETEEILTGEIEGLVGVSSDERYAVLLLDSSGGVDLVDTYMDFAMYGDGELGLYLLTDYTIAVLDLRTNEIEYTFSSSEIGDNSVPYLTNCGLNCSVLSMVNYTQTDINLIMPPNGNMQLVEGDLLLSESPDNQQFIVNIEGIITVADFVSGERIPLTTQSASNYALQFEWLDEATIIMTLRPRPYDEGDSVVRYTIRVP